MVFLSVIAFVICLIPVGYLILLAFASIPEPSRSKAIEPDSFHSFAILIPAHDEEVVIGNTVTRLRTLNYPESKYRVHIIADHCSDNTAGAARAAGAEVFERNEGPRSGKGAALSWGLKKVLAGSAYDAVVIFDADTRVDPDFLNVMNSSLASGSKVIQGQHIISNPDRGLFPALTWAMFIVDNRFQNLGRTNLGWSAKNMGDSICFRSEILQEFGWGEGLTEDYHFRQRLLLEGITITYEPYAKGYGEAPATWQQARAQRTRWLRGTYDSSTQYTKKLLAEGIKQRNPAMLDGVIQSLLPSYSSVAVVSLLILLIHLTIEWLFQPVFPTVLIAAWASLVGVCIFYPFFGLMLERAPLKAYLVIFSGAFFVVWRTLLAVKARLSRSPISWVRTEHGKS